MPLKNVVILRYCFALVKEERECERKKEEEKCSEEKRKIII